MRGCSALWRNLFRGGISLYKTGSYVFVFEIFQDYRRFQRYFLVVKKIRKWFGEFLHFVRVEFVPQRKGEVWPSGLNQSR